MEVGLRKDLDFRLIFLVGNLDSFFRQIGSEKLRTFQFCLKKSEQQQF